MEKPSDSKKDNVSSVSKFMSNYMKLFPANPYLTSQDDKRMVALSGTVSVMASFGDSLWACSGAALKANLRTLPPLLLDPPVCSLKDPWGAVPKDPILKFDGFLNYLSICRELSIHILCMHKNMCYEFSKS